jgi:hypothetical protein
VAALGLPWRRTPERGGQASGIAQKPIKAAACHGAGHGFGDRRLFCVDSFLRRFPCWRVAVLEEFRIIFAKYDAKRPGAPHGNQRHVQKMA